MAQIKGTDNTAKEAVDALLADIERIRQLSFKYGGKLRGNAKAKGEMPQIVTQFAAQISNTTGEISLAVGLTIPCIRTPNGEGYLTSPDLEFDDAPAPAPAPAPNP
ncbi:MAG: hypothetical protein J7647_01685 [Cyanobacteria bacterium SBLK]|nr:hypothetical protein [Cyanobacteria bacterium SBLK]